METNTQSSELRGHRTLATVVFTDCVGFSARMSRDEDHTLDLIRRDLKLMQKVCEKYEGRVLKSTGDGLLMYFISAIRAVKCALEIQEKIGEATAVLSERDSLKHRIGVHLADMFITDTDVMGNGVNIAARLQAEADPGGIIISQTVYDVVKNGLQITTQYLGPRKLKNIDEVVPAYKVLLHPEEEPQDAFGLVVEKLQQNKNQLRIRKLIYYACKNVWESDTNSLNSLDLHELLQDLVKLAPSPNQLQNFLHSAVKTLSKPAEYGAIANLILAEAGQLYPTASPPVDLDGSTTQVTAHREMPHVVSPEAETLYSRVAQTIERSSNLSRIKKLCYYVCRNKWESNPDQLNAVSMTTLVAEAHHLFPTAERLQTTLDRFVQTLSKSAEYQLVANTILQQFYPLYHSQPEAPASHTTQPPAPPPQESAASAPVEPDPGQICREVGTALEQEQNLLRIKKLMLYLCDRRWENNASALNNLNTENLVRQLYQIAPAGKQLEEALGSVVRTLSKPAEYGAIAHTILRHMAPLYPGYQLPAAPAEAPPPAESSAAELAAAQPVGSHQTPVAEPLFSLFDARLDIMRNANPLCAKILLFSALRGEFTFSYQDWLNLKAIDLDGLLRETLNQCRSYTDLEDLLYRAARKQPNPDEYVHTATRLIKSLRFFYVHGSIPLTVPPIVEDTDITPVDNPETCMAEGTPTALQELDEMTCQLANRYSNPDLADLAGKAEPDVPPGSEAIATSDWLVSSNPPSDPGVANNGAE